MPRDDGSLSQSTTQGLPMPCPFCGTTAGVHQAEDDMWSVKCENVKCGVFPDTWGFADRHEAIAAWNTRPPANPTVHEYNAVLTQLVRMEVRLETAVKALNDVSARAMASLTEIREMTP